MKDQKEEREIRIQMTIHDQINHISSTCKNPYKGSFIINGKP